jgi:UTP--glucose-1-phosphate uridylyltransferase
MKLLNKFKKVPEVTKAIFPVAGFGTRFLPATKAQPKEMLPVVDRPAIQYLVEEAAEAGIKDVIFVTGRGKRAIEDHFDYSFELDRNLVEKNKLNLVKEVRRISNLANFSYVRQPMPLGDGHAINCAAHLIGEEPILVMFGDTLYDGASSPAEQVITAYRECGTSVVGLSRVGVDEVDQFGVIDGQELGDNLWLINRFVEKPKTEEAPSNLAAVGVYIITPEVMTVLAKMKKGESGEIRLADAFAQLLAQGGRIHGQVLEGEWLDTGNKLGWIKANIKLGLKNKEIGEDLAAFLKGECNI